MYDRAERKFTFQGKTGTSARVGPGSYEINDASGCRYDIGYAPFNSLDERKLQFTCEDAVRLPAPWEYKPSDSLHKIKGCSSLANTAPRFQRYRSEGPGPDAYFIASPWAGKKPDPCNMYMPDILLKAALNQNAPESKGALFDRIPFVRYRDVPSIPSGPYAHGYQEAPDGRLMPQEGPLHDQTLGPAYYGPTGFPNFSRYKGCGWSKHTSKRQPLGVASHKLGPGQYDSGLDHWEKLAYSARERNVIQASHPLNVPRFIEKVIHDVQKQKFPGPATYSVIDSASLALGKRGPNGEIIQGAPFNVEAERFESNDTEVPGPNTYNPRLPVFTHRSVSALEKSPFNTSAERFHQKLHQTPAPNAYRPQNDILHDLAKKNPQIWLGGNPVAFGSSAKRELGGSQIGLGPARSVAEKEKIPGPTRYQPENYGRIGTATQNGPGLGSSKRELIKLQSDAPAPGTYNVVESYEKSQTKRRFAPPMTADGQARQSCFLAAAERFNKWSSLGPKDPSIPGPSEYCLPSSMNEKSGKFVYRSERFKPKETDSLPGPADYQIAPAIESCLRIDTFNQTLDGKVTSAPLALRRS